MLEAMAMRKPVLMTKSGCLHIDPENGGFGELIKPQDFNGWSVSMNKILHNKDISILWGERGRKLAESHFTLNRFNDNFLSALNEIISNQCTK
jgi:glycosyltransferase involved in cell wall biosynthesis